MRHPGDDDLHRDHPAFAEPLVADAWADLELAMDDSFPTGTYLDMSANLPIAEPERIRCPAQIIRSEFDGLASDDDLIEFFRLLPNREKQFCLMGGQGHVGPQALSRHRFLHVMQQFITLPPRRDSVAALNLRSDDRLGPPAPSPRTDPRRRGGVAFNPCAIA